MWMKLPRLQEHDSPVCRTGRLVLSMTRNCRKTGRKGYKTYVEMIPLRSHWRQESEFQEVMKEEKKEREEYFLVAAYYRFLAGSRELIQPLLGPEKNIQSHALIRTGNQQLVHHIF